MKICCKISPYWGITAEFVENILIITQLSNLVENDDYTFDIDPYVDSISNIMKEIALDRHEDDIAVIVMYGSRAKGTSHPDSDIEYIAIVENDVKVDIEFTFHGIPVDMWSQSWDTIDKISAMDGYWVLPAGSLASANPIYFRSDEDKSRWETIINRIENDDFHEKGLEIASGIYDGMYRFLGQLQMAKRLDDKHEARSCCWHLMISVTFITAHINNQYLLNNWGINIDEILSMEKQPDDLRKLLDAMVIETDYDIQIELCTQLIKNTREFLMKHSVGREAPKERLTLELLKSSDSLGYLNKIKKASRLSHIFGAGYAVHDFQSLVARDLHRIAGSWDYSSRFKFYSEYHKIYSEQFNDLYDEVSIRDFAALTRLANKMYPILLGHNKTRIPDVIDIDDIKEVMKL